MIARGAVPIADSDFLKVTGIVFCSPIFVSFVSNPATLEGTGGYFELEL